MWSLNYVAHDSEANICVVENDAQLQKILQVRDRLPHLRAIIKYRGELRERYSNVYTVSIVTLYYSTQNNWVRNTQMFTQ